MNPTDLRPVVDYAANQSDRWLFVALLIVWLATVWMLVRYFMGQINVVSNKLDETNHYVRDMMDTTIKETRSVIAANTEILREIRSMREAKTFQVQNPKQ